MKKYLTKIIMEGITLGIGTIFTALSCTCLYLRFGWTGGVKMFGALLYVIGTFLTGAAVDEVDHRVNVYYHEQKESR